MIIKCIEDLDGDVGFGYINTDDIIQYRMTHSYDHWVLQGLSSSLDSWIDICDYTDVDRARAIVLFHKAMWNIINGMDPHNIEIKSGKSKKDMSDEKED